MQMSVEAVATKRIKLSVNGSEYGVDVEPSDFLSEVLRDKLGLTGTKRGCDYGGCGCCSVLIDGELRYSCMTPVMRAVGRRVTTVEGLSRNGELHAVQQAFIEHFGFQCGYCTPGMIMASAALLETNRDPSEEEIRDGLGGVLCRCTGYMKIIESVKAAGQAMREEKP
jgi:aerobic-type carbon monoxide dehydrogenase small subunit (CoxS/CutS family)